MSIPASQVKELREMSGVGMMECKKALVETDGDLQKALDLLRANSSLKAENKSSWVAADGAVKIADNSAYTSLVEINSETDFVATNKEFTDLVDLILDEGFGITDKDKLLNKSVSVSYTHLTLPTKRIV